MFPKQTLLQKSTLATQVQIPILSLLIKPLCKTVSDELVAVLPARGKADGDGTICGFTPSTTAVPVIPTKVERIKPGLERSIRYHNTGLIRANARDTCRVDCQGSLRCDPVSYVWVFQLLVGFLTMAKAMPTKAPMPRIIGFQPAISPFLGRAVRLSSSSVLPLEGLGVPGIAMDADSS